MTSTAQHTAPETLNYNARAAHVAISNQVAHHGIDIAKELYNAATLFNSAYFGGALLPCFVEITTPGSLRALADYRPKTPEGIESHIRISLPAAQEGLAFALDVLLHEMVHAFQEEIVGDLELGYKGHGPKWTAQCNRIGKVLGLPEVFTKGRGGPNSASWPLCVRPPGYYGNGKLMSRKTAPKPEPRKTTPRPAPVAPSLQEQLAALLSQCDRATLQAVGAMVEKLLAD